MIYDVDVVVRYTFQTQAESLDEATLDGYEYEQFLDSAKVEIITVEEAENQSLEGW